MDRLRTIEIFTRVATLGSFSKAAAELDLPASSVTAAVQELEARLGARLLQRTTRRVSLTPVGAGYLESSTRLLRELNELDDAVSHNSPRGLVRVALPAGLARHLVAPALPDLLGRHPGLDLELRGVEDTPLPGADGPDAVITTTEVHDPRLVSRRLGAFPLDTVAAPAWLSGHGTPRTIEELSRHPVIAVLPGRGGPPAPMRLHDGEVEHTFLAAHRVAATDADTALALAVAGLGILQAPRDRALRTHLERGVLVRLFTEWPPGSWPLFAVYPREGAASARVRVFVDWLSEIIARETATAWQAPAAGRRPTGR